MLSKPLRGKHVNQRHWSAKGLTAQWLFNEGCGGKAFDSSVNNHTGSLFSMAFPPTATSGWCAGRKGTSLRFDGSNDLVYCGVSADLKTNIGTVEAWVKSTVNSKVVFSSGHGANDLLYLMLMAKSDGVYFYRSGTQRGGTTGVNAVDGKWHHLVWQSNGSKWIGYIDGIEYNITMDAGSNDGVWFSDIATNNFAIGVLYRPSKYGWFNGEIDSVRVYDYALSAAEIRGLYYGDYAMFNPIFSIDTTIVGDMSIPIAMHHYEMLRA